MMRILDNGLKVKMPPIPNNTYKVENDILKNEH